jgi:hypothetical protein
LKGVPHTIKVERHGNELVVHLVLLGEPHPHWPSGIILSSEGWVDIGYGLHLFLAVAHGVPQHVAHPKLEYVGERKKGFRERLFGKRPEQPLLEAK